MPSDSNYDDLEAMVMLLHVMAISECCAHHGTRKLAVALLTLQSVLGLDTKDLISYMQTIEINAEEIKRKQVDLNNVEMKGSIQ